MIYDESSCSIPDRLMPAENSLGNLKGSWMELISSVLMIPKPPTSSHVTLGILAIVSFLFRTLSTISTKENSTEYIVGIVHMNSRGDFQEPSLYIYTRIYYESKVKSIRQRSVNCKVQA